MFFFIKDHFYFFVVKVNFLDNSAVAVKYTGSFLNHYTVISQYFPSHLVIIFDLHHFVALAENGIMHCHFRFPR